MKPEISLKELIVRPIAPFEIPTWNTLMSKYHYLGFKWIPGKSLKYIAILGEELVALIGWGSAALKCGVRDRYIGWTRELREKRLGYVLNNVRFLVLPWINHKNLASKVLSLNLKRLSQDFELVYGHRLYLAETFVDQELYVGTCYQASNWRHIGYSLGYGKCNRKYHKHGRKKAVYIYPLHRRSLEILTGDFLPYDLNLIKGEMMINKIIDFPVKGLLLEISKVTDPRKRRGIRYPFESILSISVCAVIMGCRSFRAIGEWAECLTSKELIRFGISRGRAPSETAIRRVLQRIDAQEFDKRIYNWLVKQGVLKGKGIALDGKTLRGSKDRDKKGRHLLSAVIQKEGVVIAQEEVGEKTNEIKHFRPLFSDMDISGAVVTADAMHTQTDAAKYVVDEKKADYVFTVKGNQETLLKDIEDLELKKKRQIMKP